MRAVRRILGLPRRKEARVPRKDYRLRDDDKLVLLPIQSDALGEIELLGGLLGAIGVGLGKTLISMLAPEAVGAKNALLLVPSSVYPQTMQDMAKLKADWKIHSLSVNTYHRLQVRSGAKMLDNLKPDLIICDEAHLLKRISAARTSRIMDYLIENQGTKLILLSGTITSKSLGDYAHLSALALGAGSPVPIPLIEKHALKHWCNILDPDVDSDPDGSDWAAIKPLNPAGTKREHFRLAFKERLIETPGVIVSSNAGLEASVRIMKVKKLPAELMTQTMTIYRDVQASHQRPDGEVFPDDAAEWRCLRELGLGFFYYWVWKDGIVDEEWLDARSNWHRAVRAELEANRAKGYDTPLMVAETLEDEEQSHLARCYRSWLKVKDHPGPDTVPMWVTDKIIEHVCLSTKHKNPTIFWYRSRAVEAELSKHIYVPGAGNEPPSIATGHVGLSIDSHRNGWNLQHYHHNYVLEPPSSPEAWEQMIGRTHRTGQKADTVFVKALQHTPIFQNSFRKALNRADYFFQTTGNPQRILYADYVDSIED